MKNSLDIGGWEGEQISRCPLPHLTSPCLHSCVESFVMVKSETAFCVSAHIAHTHVVQGKT